MWVITPEIQALLDDNLLVIRDYVWFVARRRSDNSPVTEGLWSGVENVTAQVIDPDTMGEVNRDFYGVGTLVSISAIPMVANLTAQSCTITASHLHAETERIIRDYNCQQARVEIFRGLYNPATMQPETPAVPVFVGFVDTIIVETPKEGGIGSTKFSCKSHMQEITRASAETRSHAYQILRDPNDDFLIDADTVSSWEQFWGSTKGGVPTQKKRKKFLGIF